MFHIQIQEPTRSSTTTRAFVFLQNFIITKYLKQEVNGDLSLCVVEHSLWPFYNWRYKDLSMSCDQKVMMLLPPMEKGPIDFNHGAAFTAQIL